ncbi:response regulator transcription factor [Bradyrhizobium liaoningense]
MRILAVDNEEAYLRALEVMLGAEKFNVYGVDSAEEAVELGKLYDYDLIVLGLADAGRVVRELRAAKVKTPILVTSRSPDIEDIVRMLDAGADDCMTKPFHKDELVARIHAIVRRSKGHAASKITVGEICVNLDTKVVTVSGQQVPLTTKEFQMMELLALRQGMTISKEMFLNHLYGGMDEPELKIIDVFICKLRKKLPAGAIETVWGGGYLLGDPKRDAASLGSEIRAASSEFGIFASHGVRSAGAA